MVRLLAFAVVVAVLGCAKPKPPSPAVEKPAESRRGAMLETVKYPSGKTTLSGFLCRPTSEGPYPGVLMIPDRMGVSESLKRQACVLSQKEYVVLVVDLYRGETAKTAKAAEELERGLPKERAVGDLKAAVDYLSERRDVRASTLGVIGFGMGGGYALEAALHDPRLRAVVTAYSPLPDDPEQLKSLKGSVLCILAGKDKGVTPESIEPFRKAMVNAGKSLEQIHVYAACPYGFLDEANWPIYGKPDLEDVVAAWKIIAAYLHKELQQHPPTKA